MIEAMFSGSRTFRFVPGNRAYAESVQALAGFGIVRAVLRQQLPYEQGFAAAVGHLNGLGQTASALCAIELRIPTPFTLAEFAAFNADYATLLAELGILTWVDGVERSPLARTNVALAYPALGEPSLHAFCYTAPLVSAAPQFVVSGCGDLHDGADLASSIVRYGEQKAEAMGEKAAFALAELDAALGRQQLQWSHATNIIVYTAQSFDYVCSRVLLPHIPSMQQIGVQWFYSRPPIVGMEFEMDVRGIAQELSL